MPIGSGLSSSVGIATESTVGTPVAVTRFVEFDSENVQEKIHTAQGSGMRGGALLMRGSRRIIVAREAQGDINFDIPTAGFGLWLQHMLGSFSTTPTSIGGGFFQQIHNTGSLQGKSFTTQIVRPDTTTSLTQNAITYAGCKVTNWEVDIKQAAQVSLKLTIDALDVFTPQNATANTTLSSAASAAATTISTVATIPAGSFITIDSGTIRETILTSNVSGAGPFTVTLATPLSFAHASGASVGSPTAVNAGAAVALQSPTYTAGTSIFGFGDASVVAGGSTSVVSGVWTNTGGITVGNVRTITIKGTNPLKVDRWGAGQKTRSEQLENNWRTYELDLEVEYNSRLYYDAYLAQTPLATYVNCTSPTGAALGFYFPMGYQEDGATPNVGSEDIIVQKLQFTLLDDGTNGGLQVVYKSTDAAV